MTIRVGQSTKFTYKDVPGFVRFKLKVWAEDPKVKLLASGAFFAGLAILIGASSLFTGGGALLIGALALGAGLCAAGGLGGLIWGLNKILPTGPENKRQPASIPH